MVPRRSGSPSRASTVRSGLSRSRIGASRLLPVDGIWSTTHTAASISAGSAATRWRSASTPPAEAAIPITRRGGLAPMSTHHQAYALVGQCLLCGFENGHPAPVAALVVADRPGVFGGQAGEDRGRVLTVVAGPRRCGGQLLGALDDGAAVAVRALVLEHGAQIG